MLVIPNFLPIKPGKFLISKILTHLFGTFTIKTKSDILLEVFLTSSQDQYYLISKNIDFLYNEICILNTDSVYVDIGANIGFYSILASKIVGPNGKIFSFEPSPREYSRFLNGIRLNNCNNIVPYNLSLFDKKDIIGLQISNYHSGLNRLHNNTQETSTTIQSPTFRFDEIFDQNITKIDLLKIDVEGAEMNILNGMYIFLKNKVIKKIFIEITPKFLNDFGYTKEDIYSYLHQFGYEAKYNSNEWQYDEIFTLK